MKAKGDLGAKMQLLNKEEDYLLKSLLDKCVLTFVILEMFTTGSAGSSRRHKSATSKQGFPTHKQITGLFALS